MGRGGQVLLDQFSGTRVSITPLLLGKRVGLRVGRHCCFLGEFPNVRAVYPWGKVKLTCVSFIVVETTKADNHYISRDKTPVSEGNVNCIV